MSNTQFLVALGICISLSSTLAAAETTTTAPQTIESSTVSQDTASQGATSQNNQAQAPTDAPTAAATSDASIPNDNNSQAINNTADNTATESRPTLLQRSVNTIGAIGNRSIEQVSALGSKIAVNANASQPDSVKDPFEHFNRKIYSFNMKLDQYIMLPVARTYKNVVPTPIRHGVTNFFINLSTPWTAVNNLLQGHPGTSIESLSRFVINTTTSLGFYDTATYLGIDRSDEDFGLTLGKWGVGSGPYVMLPLFGPSTVRDTFTRVVDQFAAPQNYVDNTWESIGLTGIKFVDLRASLIGLESFVQGDQYTLLRDVYLQRRQFENGSPTTPQSNNGDDGFSNNDFGDDGFGDNDSKTQSSNTPATPVEQIPQSDPAIAQSAKSVDTTAAPVNLNTSAVTPTPSAQF